MNNVGLIHCKKKRYTAPDAGIRKGIKHEELLDRANEGAEFKQWLHFQVFDNAKYIYINPEVQEEEK